MHDAHVGSIGDGLKAPLHFHPLRHAFDVREPDGRWYRAARWMDPHSRLPPRGPAHDTEWTRGAHLDDAASIAAPLHKPCITIVGEQRRPPLDLGGEPEDLLQGRPDDLLVHRRHRTADRHRAQLEWGRKSGHKDELYTASVCRAIRKTPGGG